MLALFAQAVQGVQQQAPPFINWSINIYDLILLAGAAMLIYGRLVKLETQIAPIVKWWNQMVEADHRIGRRWTDHRPPATEDRS